MFRVQGEISLLSFAFVDLTARSLAWARDDMLIGFEMKGSGFPVVMAAESMCQATGNQQAENALPQICSVGVPSVFYKFPVTFSRFATEMLYEKTAS